jgi:hypothetical protein
MASDAAVASDSSAARGRSGARDASPAHDVAPAATLEPFAASDATPASSAEAPLGSTAPAPGNDIAERSSAESRLATSHEIAAPAAPCQNCGAPLTGKYCATCGQRHDPHIHSLGEFVAEATESITHADSRLWRTLWALIAKPGFLTKEFLEGRRARYLPPFRLYLVLSVVFFLIAAAGSSHNTVGFVGLHDDAAKSPLYVQKLEDLPAKPAETPEQRANRICTDFNFALGSNEGLVDGPAVCRKIVGDNGHALVQALYHNIPRALIVFLPLLALTMRLMYLRRHYVEHLLFFVHTHAYVFVFLTLYVLVMRFVPSKSVQDTATVVMLLGLPYYTYRAMLRVYGQRKWVTRAKFSALTLSYLVLGVIMTVLLGLYTAVTL